MKKASEIGVFKKFFLKLLTELQENFLRSGNTKLYYFLTQIHFRLYFGESIEKHISSGCCSRELTLAAHRHGCMVVNNVFQHIDYSDRRRFIYALAVTSFIKNLMLELPLQ